MLSAIVLAYAAPFAVVTLIYFGVRRRGERASVALYEESVEAGLTEPASLHPLIDETRCLGCGACARACPEGTVIGIIGGKATLVEAANCIGHGACKTACPFDAITLVFGTEKRGVDIPEVGPDFQTNVPGLFIAGELGGMGLIRNAIEQGRQAIDGIVAEATTRRHPTCDLLIVGAGPAGLSAGLAARKNNLRFHIIEQESFGGTVAHFPRGKVVMTQPVELPLAGRMNFREVSKESLLAFWNDVLKRFPLPVTYGERVEHITAGSGGFEVKTTGGVREAATVLLAIGRRGTPRKLDVPGEDASSKVVYRLVDPSQYRGKRVLVVGGGDSALEAAAEIADEPGTHVTLSYRGDAFGRAKPKNRKRVDDCVARGAIDLKLASKVVAVGVEDVTIEVRKERETIPNDAVIVCAGGVLPTQFLRDIGISVETKHGTA
mgnify:CR=1 FL=1